MLDADWYIYLTRARRFKLGLADLFVETENKQDM